MRPSPNRILSAFAAMTACLFMVSTAAQAVPKTFKHDSFSPSISAAATELGEQSLEIQAGFAKGEAFGQIYVPEPSDYPITIKGLQFFFGPSDTENMDQKITAMIEIYSGEGVSAKPPNGAPIFSINVSDLLVEGGSATSQTGFFKANQAIALNFNPSEEGGAPPKIFSGNIWVMVRFLFQGKVETVGCGPCKCQVLGTIHDAAPTTGRNIINYIESGVCTDSATGWAFFDELFPGDPPGDIVMRMSADVNEAGCVSSCVGKACGSDGCGGDCGACGAFEFCDEGSFTCKPTCTPNCTGKTCGSNGCGGLCGTCADGYGCSGGACIPIGGGPCVGKTCGPGTDGSSCGDCTTGLACYQNACVDPSAIPSGGAVTVTTVSPAFGTTDRSTDISIAGTGFAAGAEVRLGAESLGVLSVTGSTLISARVDAGMAPGIYALTVIVGEDTATIPDAFEVRAAPASDAGGCQGGGAANGLVLLLAMVGLVLGRRRGKSTRSFKRTFGQTRPTPLDSDSV